jgi:hypothetical protein
MAMGKEDWGNGNGTGAGAKAIAMGQWGNGDRSYFDRVATAKATA